MYGTTLRYARSAKTLRRKLAEQARQFELERALDDEKARELFETRNRARELERDLRAWDGASSATAAIAARLRSARDASPPPTRADAGMTERAYARSVIPASARVGGGDASLADRSRAAIAAVALDAPSHARRSRSSSLARFRVSNSSRAFSSSSARSSSNWRACSASLRRKVFAERAYLRVVPYKATSGRSSKASVGVEGVEDGD